MNSQDFLTLLFHALLTLNEAVTATTVIIAASLMFYNLAHGLANRVVRASSIVLACVVAVYVGDVFVALGYRNPIAHIEFWLRFEWLGVAFIPAALFHLSDALLETTGMASRGRRLRVLRILYLYSAIFALIAFSTNLLVVHDPTHNFTNDTLPALRAGSLWPLFLLYFGGVLFVAFNNVLRARRRCLTRVTHRRMSYLLLSFLMPAIGIFPYALLYAPSQDSGVLMLTVSLIDIGNVGIALMLAFMAYPLAFFGQDRPDRVIKADLLRFFLHGPLTGVVVLAVILFIPGIMATLNFPGTNFLPFMAVAAVLIVQWGIAIILPFFDRLLVYADDQDQALQLQRLSDRLMTSSDAQQQLETILAALCDYLRVSSAFVVSFGADGAQLESVVGSLLPSQTWLASPEFQALADSDAPLPEGYTVYGDLLAWQSFWLVQLRSTRRLTIDLEDVDADDPHRMVGLLGLWARAPQPDLSEDERETFRALYRRAARVLDDMQIQSGVFAALRGLVPEIGTISRLSGAARYGNIPALVESSRKVDESIPSIDSALADLIHEALRDYWGGPNLTASPLLDLHVVQQALSENDNNPASAVRAVLNRAIESLRPAGSPRKTPDWTLYNVLHMRFVQGQKVSEVADSLAMSNANIHRKQRVAIEQVAARLADMEQDAQHRIAPPKDRSKDPPDGSHPPPASSVPRPPTANGSATIVTPQPQKPAYKR